MNTWVTRLAAKGTFKAALAAAAIGILPTFAFADHDDHDDRDRHDRVEHHDRVERREAEHREAAHREAERRDHDRHFEYRDRWQLREGHWYRHHGYFRDGVWVDVDVVPDLTVVSPPTEDIIVEAPAPEPVYQEREVKVWVDPVYRTVIDRVWVPERTEVRDVVRVNFGIRFVTRERVVVEPGHYADVERRELVTPGHYETRIERVQVQAPPPPPTPTIVVPVPAVPN